LKAFHQFADTTEAVAASSAIVEGKLSKELKKFLKTSVKGKDLKDKLGVVDPKVAGLIHDKLSIKCANDDRVMELIRGIRSQQPSLLQKEDVNLKAMTLGLAHTLSRYKLKFSPDKVDTMIVQAIGLLDELDKEINTYAMRSREWFGWHFPEMGKIVVDNLQYCQCVLKMGMRAKASQLDFSDILTEDVEVTLKEVAEVSMGTEISEEDVENIKSLCTQVIDMTEYRAELYDYLKKRMAAVAPNLTIMVGELVGARLIAHAGSLMNLAKHPASTVQILGAEKALFRALKTKHETPKYGLIYHASLIGQTAPKFKGKISRVLAAKTALAIRVDALGDKSEPTVGYENRAKVEARMRQLEGGGQMALSGGGKAATTLEKYVKPQSASDGSYSTAADSTLEASGKRKASKDADDGKKKKKKAKKDRDSAETDVATEKKKKKKKKVEDAETSEEAPKKKKKKKKDDADDAPKKKKKKKKDE